MNRLCLGTYLTVLILCRGNQKTSGQKKILNALVKSIVAQEIDITAPEVSKIKKGSKDLEYYISDSIQHVLETTEDFSEIQKRFDDLVIPLIHPDKIAESAQAIRRIISEDNSIGNNYLVDPVNKISKSELSDRELDSKFLLGTFVYTLRNTNNVKCEKYVKKITPEFIESSFPSTESPAINFSAISPEKSFCIRYESSIDLLPLCQIANIINPTHNHVNEMYTEFCRFSEDIQRKIMFLNNYPFIKFNHSDIYSLLPKYEVTIEKIGLSSSKFLYAFSQYIPRTLDYENTIIVDNNPVIFPCKPSMLMPARTSCNLSQFIDNYLYDSRKISDLGKPLDWLWNNQSLSSCTEENLIFWYNFFIFVSCDFIKSNYTNSGDSDIGLDCPDIYALKTFEDLHYAMLLKLYQTFECPEK